MLINSSGWTIAVVLAALSMICAQQVQKAARAAPVSPVEAAVKRALGNGIKGDNKSLRQAMGEIEDELAVDVDLNEVEPNLSHALELLEEAKDFSGIDAGRLNALELLAALQRVWDGSLTCREGYIILAKTDLALQGKAVRASRQASSSSRSLPLVVGRIAIKHARRCQQTYPAAYSRLVKEMPASAHEHVRVFIDLLVEVHIKRSERQSGWALFGGPKLTPGDATKAPLIMGSYKSMAGKDEADIAYRFLKDFVRDDPDQWYLTRVPVSANNDKLVLDVGKISQLLRRHLIEPCKRYVQLLGPDVFEPFEFDAQVLGPTDADDVRQPDGDQVEFQRARIRYNLCKKLVRRDEKPLLRGIVAVAKAAPINSFHL